MVAQPEHVWLVCDELHHPVAAFTVKHRCAEWLDDNVEVDDDRYNVWKYTNCTAQAEGPIWPEDIIIWWRQRYAGRDL